MTSQDFLTPGESSLSPSIHDHLERENLLSMRKAHLLEVFLVQNTHNVQAMAARRNALTDRIFAMEQEISSIGLISEARRYLGDDNFLSYAPNEPEKSSRSSEPGLPSRKAVRWNQPGHPPLNRERLMLTHFKRPSLEGDVIEPASKRPKVFDDGPCLRCKMLKKKCDTLSNCNHCPLQSFDNENDYWRVLGCTRGQLQELSKIFCPGFSRTSRRTLRCQSGHILTIDLELIRSTVSISKKTRIVQLIDNRDDFRDLSDLAWSNVENRKALSRFATMQRPAPGEVVDHSRLSLSEEYEAPWALIQAVSMDSIYGQTTEYNPFVLLRLGNSFLKAGPASWDLYLRSKRIFRLSYERYLLEQLCGQVAFGDLRDSPAFDPAKLPQSNSLVMVDIKADMEDFLAAFESACTGRGRLTGQPQLACFFALTVFSIAKGLLIDAYAVRSTCEDVNPWNETYALQITSAFKALVSLFSWSSKSDVILSNDSNLSPVALGVTRQMVAVDKWQERGFKSTKDFLLSLGSFVGEDYNGFFRQKFGIEKAPELVPRTTISDPARTINQSSTTTESPTIPSVLRTMFAPTPALQDLPTDSEHGMSPRSPDTLPAEYDLSPHTPSSHSRCSSISATSKSSTASASETTNFTFVSHDQASKSRKMRWYGGRRGALDDATLKKVRDVRKVGACWKCWAMKMPCSEGDPCDRCKPETRSKKHRICNRAPFVSQIPIFFPELLNSHFTPEVTETFIYQNVLIFSNPSMPVVITWPGQPELEVEASIYTPMSCSTAQNSYDGQSGNALGVGSLPVGLSPADATQAKASCIKHIQSLLETPSHKQSQLLNNRIAASSKAVTQSIQTFYHSMPQRSALLHDALQFHLILNMMSIPIMFSDSSAAVIVAKLGRNTAESKFFSSRLLNRQIKQIILLHSREVLGRVLASLEKVVRGRKASSWPVAFATMMILCKSVELLQSQAAIHASTSGSNPVYSTKVCEEAKYICDSLEVFLFDQLSYLFHTIFRTAQSKEKGGINPFRDSTDGLDRHTADMVKAIAEVMNEDLASTIGEEDLPPSRERAEWTSKGNSGRLIFKFLSHFNSKAAK